jgi:tRNA pseudouridine38-40 synthase
VTNAVLLTVAYDGRPFSGFAPQPDRRTIAGEVLGAIRAIDPTVSEVRGASRTDAGVHARGQRVAFDPKTALPARAWVHALTRHLPSEISVRRAAFVKRGFVPRFDSVAKRYRYLVLVDRVRDPFLEGLVWRVPGGLGEDIAFARGSAEAARARGSHDFAGFRSSADQRQRTVRTLHDVALAIDPADTRLWRIDVHGDAFMHNMVRILVGTIVDVARGRLEPGAVTRGLASHDRRDLGITAPPDGLYLERVELADDGVDGWP